MSSEEFTIDPERAQSVLRQTLEDTPRRYLLHVLAAAHLGNAEQLIVAPRTPVSIGYELLTKAHRGYSLWASLDGVQRDAAFLESLENGFLQRKDRFLYRLSLAFNKIWLLGCRKLVVEIWDGRRATQLVKTHKGTQLLSKRRREVSWKPPGLRLVYWEKHLSSSASRYEFLDRTGEEKLSWLWEALTGAKVPTQTYRLDRWGRVRISPLQFDSNDTILWQRTYDREHLELRLSKSYRSRFIPVIDGAAHTPVLLTSESQDFIPGLDIVAAHPNLKVDASHQSVVEDDTVRQTVRQAVRLFLESLPETLSTESGEIRRHLATHHRGFGMARLEELECWPSGGGNRSSLQSLRTLPPSELEQLDPADLAIIREINFGRTRPTFRNGYAPPANLLIHPTLPLVAMILKDENLLVVDLETTELQRTELPLLVMLQLAWHPTRPILAVSTSPQMTLIVDPASHEYQKIQGPSHGGFCFSADGKFWNSLDQWMEGQFKIWGSEFETNNDGTSLKSSKLRFQSDNVGDYDSLVSVSDCGLYAVMGGINGALDLLSLRNGDRLKQSKEVLQAFFTPKGHLALRFKDRVSILEVPSLKALTDQTGDFSGLSLDGTPIHTTSEFRSDDEILLPSGVPSNPHYRDFSNTHPFAISKHIDGEFDPLWKFYNPEVLILPEALIWCGENGSFRLLNSGTEIQYLKDRFPSSFLMQDLNWDKFHPITDKPLDFLQLGDTVFDAARERWYRPIQVFQAEDSSILVETTSGKRVENAPKRLVMANLNAAIGFTETSSHFVRHSFISKTTLSLPEGTLPRLHPYEDVVLYSEKTATKVLVKGELVDTLEGWSPRFSPSGRVFCLQQPKTLTIYRTEDRSIVATLTGDKLLEFDPAGNMGFVTDRCIQYESYCWSSTDSGWTEWKCWNVKDTLFSSGSGKVGILIENGELIFIDLEGGYPRGVLHGLGDDWVFYDDAGRFEGAVEQMIPKPEEAQVIPGLLQEFILENLF